MWSLSVQAVIFFSCHAGDLRHAVVLAVVIIFHYWCCVGSMIILFYLILPLVWAKCEIKLSFNTPENIGLCYAVCCIMKSQDTGGLSEHIVFVMWELLCFNFVCAISLISACLDCIFKVKLLRISCLLDIVWCMYFKHM